VTKITVDVCDNVPPASLSPSGVLTPYPHISVADVPAGLTINSLNFSYIESSKLVNLYADISNTGTATICPGADLLVDSVDFNGSITMPPYHSTISSSQTTACLAPGDAGILSGLASIPNKEQFLESASALHLTIQDFSFGDYVPAAGGPSLSAPVIESESAWAISGSAYIPETMYNVLLTFFARDDRGLIIVQDGAYLRDGGTLLGGSSEPFSSFGTPCEYSQFESFTTWIQGAAVAAPLSPQGRHEEARRAARQALRAAD
jgi:hypothetical protein